MVERTWYVVKVKTPFTEYIMLKNGREARYDDVQEAWAALDAITPYLSPEAISWVAALTETEVMR